MSYEIVLGRTDEEKEKYGNEGAIYIGKTYVKMENVVSFGNKVYLDVAHPHVVLVSGKRGQGKSYTLGVIAEGMNLLPSKYKNNLSVLIMDTLGIFWTFKYANYRDDELLNKWDLKPQSVNSKVYVPYKYFNQLKEEGLPVDKPFSLPINEFSASDWANIFKIDLISNMGVLLDEAMRKLEGEYNINDIIDSIDKVEGDPTIKRALKNRFEMVREWGLFSDKYTSIREFLEGGTINVIDISVYTYLEWDVKSLAISLFAKKILQERMKARKEEELNIIEEGISYFSEFKRKTPLVWMFIDEAHEFLPKNGKTVATWPLVQWLREGRQPGCSLILATQQPGKIHGDVMTQSDIVISHRVTAKSDIEGLNAIMHTYQSKSIERYLDELPKRKGAAIVLDDKQERIYPIQIRPRYTWHGGADASLI